ncbi:tRNA 2-selenouridine(34) synthase MnmH [Paenibacillus sp. M1]|uniref:tRNA 2-selenouridine(34) synthase MnmH n=1 Tax=Paenibacillus haidiansis TaxID=1574488 RepID=A0ABU7VWM4_9BACL
MFQDISVEELQDNKKGEMVLIDVRSPSEYASATIPGSINIPFFDDRERAEVGTLYKQTSVDAAKERGLEIISAKLPALMKQFQALPENKVVFCWRGGMRSRTTATLLSLMNIHSCRLTGGYRAYRQWVVGMLESMPFAPPAYVIHGHTGSGKTAILRALQEQGYPVLDLEGMAGHRGSVFGEIGLRAHNQKTFDALLLNELLRYRETPYVLMEAESKRIGKVVIPELVLDKKEKGTHIRVELPVEARVRTILEDYRPWENPGACIKAFERIEERIHRPIAVEIGDCLRNGQYDRAVELLLLYYYDPRYTYSEEQYPEAEFMTIAADSVEEAVRAVERLLPKTGESAGQAGRGV